MPINVKFSLQEVWVSKAVAAGPKVQKQINIHCGSTRRKHGRTFIFLILK